MRLGLIILVLIGTCYSQVDRDWSLEKMCDYYGGKFTKRADQQVAGTGDTCVELKFQYAVETDIMARRLCEEMFPYHVTKATRDTKEMITECDVEAGLMCKKDWIQLYGRCYKMEKKLMKYQDAKDHCKGEGATIGFIHRDITAVHWKDYYTGVSRIWVDASDVYKNDLIYNEGDDMMLVFDGIFYDVKSFSLIRVDGKKEKAMVLCEYTPPMTREESAYLIRRYSEIYHPGLTTTDGMYIRTARHLTQDAEGKPKETLDEYCKAVMKPFVTEGNGTEVAGARDQVSFHEGLLTAKEPQLTYYRSAAKLALKPRKGRDTRNCQKSQITKNQNVVWEAKTADCDGATWSYHLRMNDDKKWAVRVFSDARAAPVYCQARFKVPKYGNCPDGYTTYERTTTGVKWCHKFFPDKLTAADAVGVCAGDGAHLTGFHGKEEMDFLRDLMKTHPKFKNEHRNAFWVGAERRVACRWGKSGAGQKGWREGDGECSRKFVFEWMNGVSYNPPLFEDLWARPHEPNYLGEKENCLSIEDLGINDLNCLEKHTFACGKEAPVIS